ncbi:MAG: ORC1-type DNA replication protein [Nitrososphaerota archaeon]|jgi:cell division control protein 6|nr:ORC1-type DNA replication protein [Nitrososphaerota archaeon]
MTSSHSVFRDESKLDINYIPAKLPHREREQRLLAEFFSFLLQYPGRMSQRVILTGDVGTGKTALAQTFGTELTNQTKRKTLKFRYIHINCREFRGSLQPILHQTVTAFRANYPARGYAADEILSTLLQVLDEEETTLIITLDEFDSLIEKEGSDAVYKLTRIHETRQGKPQRLSFIFIMRDLKAIEQLDDSAKSTLQRNIIRLDRYGKSQLIDILNDRINLAFTIGAVAEDVVDLVAELSHSETGNARFGIELLWRAGKYADASGLSHVRAECIRNAISAVLPTLRRSELVSLGFHEKLFLLAIARYFKENKEEAYVPISEAEKAYGIVCEEYDELPKSHTQVWLYVQYLSKIGALKAEVVSTETRGRANRISLPSIPAVELEQTMQISLQEAKGEL